jgi:outer membrane protein TolC
MKFVVKMICLISFLIAKLKLNIMVRKIGIQLILFFIIPFLSYGQASLDLESALVLAIENNYDIKIANNSLEKAENNKSIYNTGYLPTLAVNGNANYSNTDLKITTQQGAEQSINGVATKSYGGSVGVNYLIYNGGSRQLQYDKLKTYYSISDIQQKRQIEMTLISVYTTFFNVAKNKEQKLTLEAAFKNSKERLINVKSLNKYGKKSNLDVLNAQVDSNTDSIQIVNLNSQFENNKRNLNLLLGRDLNYEFDVITTVVLETGLTYSSLVSNMYAANMQLKEIELNRVVSEYDLKMSKSGYLPSVSTSVTYALNYGDNGPASLYAYQLSNGLNAGVSLSWNVFDGGTTKVKVQNARIDIEAQKLNEQKLKINLENQLAGYWVEYRTQKVIITNEELNVQVSEQNHLKSKEQFNLGQITSLEYRQAQLNLITTQLNLLNAKYNAKLAEFQLKIMTTNLVK